MATRKTKISIFPGAACYYTYFVSGELNDAQLSSITSSLACPTWDLNTQFRIDFSNSLVAGNASFGDEPPTEYNIYRQEMNANTLKLVATISGDKKAFTDYSVKNGRTYRYYIYPSDSFKMGSPIVTGYAKYETNSWELLVADETDDENLFTLSVIYRFEFNPEDVTIQNNTGINKLRTFSRYMRIQKDQINCLSGTLSALAGIFDCDTEEYVEDMDMLDAIMALSTDTRPKFLRDFDGHLYKIDVSSPVEFTQRVFANGRRTTKKIEWTEVGSSDSAKIVAAGDLIE